MTFTCGCTYSERGSIPREEIKIIEEVKTLTKQFKYLFTDGNKRGSLVVEYEHVTKRVANVKNDIYTLDNPSSKAKNSNIT